MLNQIIGSFDNSTFSVADKRETRKEQSVKYKDCLYIDTPGLNADDYDNATALKTFKACCYEFELDNIPRILSNQGYDDEAIHQLINNNQVGESKITKMVRRFIKHLPNIARFAESKLTTGPIEGRNNLVKLIKKAKFGIKNLDSFVNVVRLRIRQEYSRNLKTKWP